MPLFGSQRRGGALTSHTSTPATKKTQTLSDSVAMVKAAATAKMTHSSLSFPTADKPTTVVYPILFSPGDAAPPPKPAPAKPAPAKPAPKP